MYQDNDKKRFDDKFDDVGTLKKKHPELTDWRIDKVRFLHSASFRRLSGKTQLYPNIESDYFRNRLTHSLEVAQVAVCITHKLNYDNNLLGTDSEINPDIVEFAALAHDLGHPPFGHIGELALHECMKKFGGFEGNAQTFRILSRIEKKIFAEDSLKFQFGVSKDGEDFRRGLNLTYRTLASIIKYCFPLGSREKLKGYYGFDQRLIQEIKRNVIPEEKREIFDNWEELEQKDDFKTVECTIMDIADDIAYATYDFEDSIQAGFITPLDLIFPEDLILEKVTEKVARTITGVTERIVKSELEEIFNIINPEFIPYKDFIWEENKRKGILKEDIEEMHKQIRKLCDNGHFRTELISGLINKFIDGTQLDLKDIPVLSVASFKERIKLQVEVLKQFVYVKLTMSPRLKIVDYRGREIVTKIFETISDGEIGEDGLELNHLSRVKKGYELLPPDFREVYDIYNELYKHFAAEEKLAKEENDEIKMNSAKYNKMSNDAKRHRVICDFIAGMTNRYAIEFYGRITSEHPATIFKGY